MTLKFLFFSLAIFLLAGCAAIEQRGATVVDGVIENPSFGFFGFSFNIPEGFELYNPALQTLQEDNEIRQLAIRIYNLNKSYHPTDTETFYESFLMLSANTGFLLITVQNGGYSSLWSDEETSIEKQLIPLYNSKDSRRVRVGNSRAEAVRTRGHAYEYKGWYYAKPKSKRMPFSYEACKIGGVDRDKYILIGFSLPEHEHILSIQMPEFMRGFRF